MTLVPASRSPTLHVGGPLQHHHRGVQGSEGGPGRSDRGRPGRQRRGGRGAARGRRRGGRDHGVASRGGSPIGRERGQWRLGSRGAEIRAARADAPLRWHGGHVSAVTGTQAPSRSGSEMALSIVVGVDGSRASVDALATAIRLAGRGGGGIHACYVDRVASPLPAGGFFVPLPPVEVDRDDRVDRLGRVVVAALGQAGIGGEFTCRRGDAAAELERLALAHEADHLVVGRSTHPHLHLGNVPGRLIAMGSRPVLVVP